MREEMGVNCCHANQDKFWVPRSRRRGVGGVSPELRSRGRRGRGVAPSRAAQPRRSPFRSPRPAPAAGPSSCALVDDAGLTERTTSWADQDHQADPVKDKYGRGGAEGRGRRRGLVLRRKRCCGSDEAADPITSNLYTATARRPRCQPRRCSLRSAAATPPPRRAATGETVLDLGSGGGIDVLLSARRVGPTGKAYGLDMTDEMLELARDNARRPARPTWSSSRARSSRSRCPTTPWT